MPQHLLGAGAVDRRHHVQAGAALAVRQLGRRQRLQLQHGRDDLGAAGRGGWGAVCLCVSVCASVCVRARVLVCEEYTHVHRHARALARGVPAAQRGARLGFARGARLGAGARPRTCVSLLAGSASRPQSTATSARSSRASFRVAPLAGLPLTMRTRMPLRCSGLTASFALGSLGCVCTRLHILNACVCGVVSVRLWDSHLHAKRCRPCTQSGVGRRRCWAHADKPTRCRRPVASPRESPHVVTSVTRLPRGAKSRRESSMLVASWPKDRTAMCLRRSCPPRARRRRGISTCGREARAAGDG